MPNAIEIRGLSKRYVVEEDRALTLKETVLRLFRTTERQEIVALKPLDLDVPRGQALGIIGRNGAGKSTLLKLISGVATPTAGSVKVEGALMALIELGAGFQFDLSGLENIYLNGCLMGLSGRQINERLASIVEFSGLADFIYTPVKHYSSGMVLRLGFSIAAHLDPDVILLDETMSVGDLKFQSKCAAKVRELKRAGKTILMVTHSLDAAEWLCDRIIWLHEGGVAASGAPEETIQRYQKSVADMPMQAWSEEARRQALHSPMPGRFGTGEAVIREFSLRDAAGRPRHVYAEGEPMLVEIAFEARREIPNLNAEIACYLEDTLFMFLISAANEGLTIHAPPGPGVIRIALDELRLRPGRYILEVALCSSDNPCEHFDFHHRIYHFGVEPRFPAQLTSAVRVPFQIEVRGIGQ